MHTLQSSKRASGILAHISSLPSPYGIGDIGPSSYAFLDFLAAAGQSCWQFLPTVPTNPLFDNSPYMSSSAFAGSPLLIAPDILFTEGLVSESGLRDHPGFSPYSTDYVAVTEYKERLLTEAFDRFSGFGGSAFRGFAAAAPWLDDYALFMLLHERHGEPWNRWPAPYAWRDAQALAALRREAAAELDFWHFVQWRFHVQWQGLRAQAQARGVHFVGDMPIFVAHHSADVWARPQLFQLDANGAPLLVAGVPPDYFSATGQRWGNPLYRWDAMATDGYAWWAQRLAHLLSLVDVVRIDHFRGFESCWADPAHAPRRGRTLAGRGRGARCSTRCASASGRCP